MGGEPDRVAMLSDVRASTDSVRAEMAALRDELSDRIQRLEERLTESFNQRISSEGETTRRHFEVVAERIEATVRLMAEVCAHHAVVLDNHESRLTQIEKTQ